MRPRLADSRRPRAARTGSLLLRVTVGTRSVELTPTEFQLLAALAREPGRVFTRSQLLDTVHGVAFESYERAIDAQLGTGPRADLARGLKALREG